MFTADFILLAFAFVWTSPAFCSAKSPHVSAECTPDRTQMRHEWRHLPPDQKRSYIDAELCLLKLPNQLDLKGSTTRFEDLQALHHNQTDIIHHVVSVWYDYMFGQGDLTRC